MCANSCTHHNAQEVHERVATFMHSLETQRRREESLLELGEALTATVETMRLAVKQHDAGCALERRTDRAQRPGESHLVPCGDRNALTAFTEDTFSHHRRRTVCVWLSTLSGDIDAGLSDSPCTSDTVTITHRATTATLIASGFSTAISHETRRVVRQADALCERLERAAQRVTVSVTAPLRHRHAVWEKQTCASLLQPVVQTAVLTCLGQLVCPSEAETSVLQSVETEIMTNVRSLFEGAEECPEDRELIVLKHRVVQQQQRLSHLLDASTEPLPVSQVGSHVLASSIRQQRLHTRARWKRGRLASTSTTSRDPA